jgi:hypothetical protein
MSIHNHAIIAKTKRTSRGNRGVESGLTPADKAMLQKDADLQKLEEIRAWILRMDNGNYSWADAKRDVVVDYAIWMFARVVI